MLSRDHLGTAVKATNAIVNGQSQAIYKDPKTDSSKKSAKGLLQVVGESGAYVLKDSVTLEEEAVGCLQTVYKDGQFVAETSLEAIRQRLWS
jgi:nicotinamide phosphoribosyltransferase